MPKMFAFLSVFDKTGLVELADELREAGLRLMASGGTARFLRDRSFEVTDVASVTHFPEMLGGRVKTLHPAVFGGILARNTDDDLADLEAKGIDRIEVVVCNLYPFEETTARADVALDEAVENIDVGGVALLRAAAKNFQRVTTLCRRSDYEAVAQELRSAGGVTLETRRKLAVKAFSLTARYESAISDYFRRAVAEGGSLQLSLRYGMNPHQKPAQIFTTGERLPFTVLNGSPGFINFCDALNAWQLVAELKDVLRLPAAASFKHVSPAGAAVGLPLSEDERKAFMIDDNAELTPLVCAFARARGADMMSSFGDLLALSDVCDEVTAKLISKEVSDGVIAPGYEGGALDILKKKKKGNYLIIQMSPDYVPDPIERRTVFGLTLEQARNDATISEDLLNNVVSTKTLMSESVRRDLLLATITLKYTQSNSISFAANGQIIGIGAGQQSRVHCTKLAAEKAKRWWMRHHPEMLALPFKPGVKRNLKANAIEALTEDEDLAELQLLEIFEEEPKVLSEGERKEWLKTLHGVSMASDAFFPFVDSISVAHKCGVDYVISPAGSQNDEAIKEACNSFGMVLVHSDLRLFHH